MTGSFTFTMTNNARRPAIFLHIQKTAGTSMTEAVRPYYQNDIVSHGDYLEHDTASLKNMRFISGHFGFEYARLFMDGRYSFTFLRDPIERILSLYYFSRTRDPAEYPIYRVAHELDLSGYLRAASIGTTSRHTCGTSRLGNSRAAGMILSNDKSLISLRRRSWSGQR